MSVFAKRHGYSTDGSVFPHRTKMFDLVLGKQPFFDNPLQGPEWRYSDLSYTVVTRTRLGDIDSEKVYYSVLELDLIRPLPHMLFDAPQAHGLAYLTQIDESQRTSLEGNFDQYFVTYFPSHYDIDARSIISPDVMSAMIDSGVSDIEIIGKKLYLYSPLIDAKHLADFIDDGLMIREKMMDHAVHYRDDRLGQAARNRGDVSEFGKKLMRRPNFPWLTTLVSLVFLAYIYFGVSRSGNWTDLGLLPTVGILVCLAGYEIYESWIKPQRELSRKEQRYYKKHGR